MSAARHYLAECAAAAHCARATHSMAMDYLRMAKALPHRAVHYRGESARLIDHSWWWLGNARRLREQSSMEWTA